MFIQNKDNIVRKQNVSNTIINKLFLKNKYFNFAIWINDCMKIKQTKSV